MTREADDPRSYHYQPKKNSPGTGKEGGRAGRKLNQGMPTTEKGGYLSIRPKKAKHALKGILCGD